MSKERIDYKLYLLSEHWKQKRIEAFKFYGKKCMMCGDSDKQLSVHHNNYDNLGNESMQDLIVLCGECHGRHHGKKGKGKGKKWKPPHNPFERDIFKKFKF